MGFYSVAADDGEQKILFRTCGQGGEIQGPGGFPPMALRCWNGVQGVEGGEDRYSLIIIPVEQFVQDLYDGRRYSEV